MPRSGVLFTSPGAPNKAAVAHLRRTCTSKQNAHVFLLSAAKDQAKKEWRYHDVKQKSLKTTFQSNVAGEARNKATWTPKKISHSFKRNQKSLQIWSIRQSSTRWYRQLQETRCDFLAPKFKVTGTVTFLEVNEDSPVHRFFVWLFLAGKCVLHEIRTF